MEKAPAETGGLLRRIPVVIVGGGPAGAATGLTLARRGVACLVLEAAPAPRWKLGETLPPAAAPLLRTLGVAAAVTAPPHLESHGNRFMWGRPEVEERPFLAHPEGHGWHLDRQAFEASLSAEARQRGVMWWSGWRLQGAERSRRSGWTLAVQGEAGVRRVQARFMVDASGRAGRLAHLQGVSHCSYDRLLGVACRWPAVAVAQWTHVEAVPQGWWYAAPLPGGDLLTVFFTDADLLDRAVLGPTGYRRALASTALAGTLVGADAGGKLEIIARPAASWRLTRAIGAGWLAVGDAAFAYDPLSSYGLTSALGGGLYAGNAAADHLVGRPEALPAYREVTAAAHTRYLEMLREQYRLERRWSARPFWRRRHLPGFARRVLPVRGSGA